MDSTASAPLIDLQHVDNSRPTSLIDLQHVTKRFRSGGTFGRGHEVVAVSDVSLSIAVGEAFGLVGESGSGKTTLGAAPQFAAESEAGVSADLRLHLP